MKATDRKLYCRVAYPYVDRPHSIGYSATISAPHMHAHALDILSDHLKPDSRVLDGKLFLLNLKICVLIKKYNFAFQLDLAQVF